MILENEGFIDDLQTSQNEISPQSSDCGAASS